MKVWLRIGPWAHGECRNGGFPDWLVEKEKRGKLSLRTDDPQYLKYVDIFFTKIAEQTGFSSLTHFNRTFKSIVGTSPSAYRKANPKHE